MSAFLCGFAAHNAPTIVHLLEIVEACYSQLFFAFIQIPQETLVSFASICPTPFTIYTPGHQV